MLFQLSSPSSKIEWNDKDSTFEKEFTYSLLAYKRVLWGVIRTGFLDN
jgi:hypothetical protein